MWIQGQYDLQFQLQVLEIFPLCRRKNPNHAQSKKKKGLIKRYPGFYPGLVGHLCSQVAPTGRRKPPTWPQDHEETSREQLNRLDKRSWPPLGRVQGFAGFLEEVSSLAGYLDPPRGRDQSLEATLTLLMGRGQGLRDYLDPPRGGVKVQGAQGLGLLRWRPERGIYSRIARAVTQRKNCFVKAK